MTDVRNRRVRGLRVPPLGWVLQGDAWWIDDRLGALAVAGFHLRQVAAGRAAADAEVGILVLSLGFVCQLVGLGSKCDVFVWLTGAIAVGVFVIPLTLGIRCGGTGGQSSLPLKLLITRWLTKACR